MKSVLGSEEIAIGKALVRELKESAWLPISNFNTFRRIFSGAAPLGAIV